MPARPVSAPTRQRRRLSEAERRTQIIDGCVEILAREGYPQASLARIAEAAGVSKGLVSHYFSDKESLMEHVARITLGRLRADFAAHIDLTADVTEVIRAAIHHASELRQTHADELRALDEIVHHLRRGDNRPALDLRSYEETYRDEERLFERGQREGVLREFDTRVMAATYQGAIDTMLAYFEAHPETDRTAYADALTDLLIAAVRR